MGGTWTSALPALCPALVARSDDDLIDDLLGFWLGTPDPDGAVSDETFGRYWRRSEAFDAEIRERFGELHARAGRGELDGWAETPRGRAALVIVLDQLSRNLHRDDPRAFDNDGKALRLALEGVERGEHLSLRPMQAYFLLMPLMHSEELAVQQRGVELFDELAARHTAPELAKCFAGAADYARRHRDIVARFGRFPHRNATVGRASTPEELEFLKQPGSSF